MRDIKTIATERIAAAMERPAVRAVAEELARLEQEYAQAQDELAAARAAYEAAQSRFEATGQQRDDALRALAHLTGQAQFPLAVVGQIVLQELSRRR